MSKTLDTDNILKIIDLMKESDLYEFEIEQEGLKIRICRAIKNNGSGLMMGSPEIQMSHTPQSIVPSPTLSANTEDLNTIFIKSPMVGTFYTSSSPESPSFINTGDLVDVSSVVCIIEAMKVMNEIHAEIKGTVIEILAKNGQGVEFGQPLFKIKPS